MFKIFTFCLYKLEKLICYLILTKCKRIKVQQNILLSCSVSPLWCLVYLFKRIGIFKHLISKWIYNRITHVIKVILWYLNGGSQRWFLIKLFKNVRDEKCMLHIYWKPKYITLFKNVLMHATITYRKSYHTSL